MFKIIPIFSNSLGNEELKAVEKVFRSRWLGYGEESKQFETEFGQKIGSKWTLTTNSCTAALFMAMNILGIGKGDEVIISTINFVGASNAILTCGARPVFADVDKDYLNILPSEIDRLRNKRTKAILLLHYGGHPAKMGAILKAAKGLFIIEDAATAIVSKYKNKNCGILGDIGCFSFDSMKIISSGDGGALCLKNKKLYQKALIYRYLGLNPKESSGIDSLKEKRGKWWEINLKTISNRYLYNDILASIARIQLKKVDKFVSKRKQIWQIYQKEFKNIGWVKIPPEPLPNTTSSYYFYWLKIRSGQRDKLARYLIDKGIYCSFYYFPLHLVKHYQAKTKLSNAEKANQEIINIPLHQNLTSKETKYIIETIKSFPH